MINNMDSTVTEKQSVVKKLSKINTAVQKGRKQLSVKKVKAKKHKKKTITRKKPVKFVIPRQLTIYDQHPMRKLFELFLYNFFAGRKFGYSDIGKKDRGPVHVSKTKLKRLTENKKRRLLINRHVSIYINHYFHPDQKIMMWDYLRYHGLPGSIDLKYNYIPSGVQDICSTIQQRRIIEGYATLRFPNNFILDEVNQIDRLKKLSNSELEIYLYFFWNIRLGKKEGLYSLQVLSNRMLELKSQVIYKNFCEQEAVLTNKTPEQIHGEYEIIPNMVNTPYYESENIEVYNNWTKFILDEEFKPFDSYDIPIRICTSSITNDDITAVLSIIDNEALTVKDRTERLLEKISMRAEGFINRGVWKSLGAFIREIFYPMAKTAATMGITMELATSRGKATDKIRVHEGSTEEYKETDEIDPIVDQKKHIELMAKLKIEKTQRIMEEIDV